MRILNAALAVGAFCAIAPGQALALSECFYQGLELRGEVEVVENDPDLRVQLVSASPDLKVSFVDRYPDQCGEWRKVGLGGDFRVQFVTDAPDLRIQEVPGAPGLP